MMARRANSKRLVALLRVASLTVVVSLIEAACRTGLIPNFTMIPPSAMAVGMWRLLAGGHLTKDLVTTLSGVSIAFILAIIVGFVAGAGLHRLRRVRRILDPLFATYYSVPVFVFYPLFIVLLGLNDGPKIVIGFLYAVVAMILNTLNGLDRVPKVLFKTSRVHRMSPIATAWYLTLPAAAPYLLTGVKQALAYALIGVIGSEFILSNAGIGYQISFAYNNFDNTAMYSLILFILIVSTTVNLAVFAWEKALLSRRGLL